MPGVMASCNTHGSEARHVQGPHGTHSVGDIQCCPHSAPVTPLMLALGVRRVASLQNSHLTAASPCWLSVVPPSVLASHGSWCLWGPYNSNSKSLPLQHMARLGCPKCNYQHHGVCCAWGPQGTRITGGFHRCVPVTQTSRVTSSTRGVGRVPVALTSGGFPWGPHGTQIMGSHPGGLGSPFIPVSWVASYSTWHIWDPHHRWLPMALSP